MARDLALTEAVIEAGVVAGQRGLLWGTGGNLSVRVSDDEFLITASGTTLDRLRTQDFVECRVHATAEKTGEGASSEVQVHRRIYQRRADVRAVVHLSPPWATLACCTKLDLPTDLIPESVLYLDRIARIGYVQPGTDDLGQAVASALGGGSVVLMRNHGPVTVGGSIVAALRRMEVLEFLARLVITARAAELPLQGIGLDAAAALRESVYDR